VRAYYCAGTAVVLLGPRPRVDSVGKPACELCGSRLTRCKLPLHKHGAGKICRQCWDGLRRPSVQTAAVAAAAAAPPPRSRKRRAQSDPGELLAGTASPALTRRITPPTPTQAVKKQCTTRQDERIMRLLDETHARRMAAEAAATAAAGAPPAMAAAAAAVGVGERGTTHTGFTLAFVP